MHLIVFDTEASLPECTDQSKAKRWKICLNENGDLVEQKLHFNTEHGLLSYFMATNVPGGDIEFFECRNGDSE